MPDIISVLPLLLLIGLLAGMMAGMLGLGGGLVVVPALFWLMRWQGVADEIAMPVAVATSLATMVLTTLSAVRSHWRQGTTRRDMLPWLLPGVVLGALIAPFLVTRIPVSLLTALFAGFMFFVALRMALPYRQPEKAGRAGRMELMLGGTLVATLSAMLGVGGGILTVPWLQWRGLAMAQAVGVSVTAVLVIGVFASLVYALAGNASELPGTIGLVHWPSVLAISAVSMFTAPLGSRLARRLPDRTLRRLFAVMLLLVGLSMLL
ncbi:sulfite exporter TauE/SafE family protein [Natronospira bacteriovora]|uniref:Probable membrane transporter protein n=1 Tax=Natronospira bacteriovora TaxID=3069753 RepID=A0ABU0W8P1_9GAMM|nr:sulfite exporter TauE/SafE family protein [Natronospira sp. AB-CW4]MDQ2070274.1 sulfite exporter TauE/SafE family protein [Natronospira sp. AB-CW4]